jgi:hypothetical protein
MKLGSQLVTLTKDMVDRAARSDGDGNINCVLAQMGMSIIDGPVTAGTYEVNSTKYSVRFLNPVESFSLVRMNMLSDWKALYGRVGVTLHVKVSEKSYE